MTNLDNIDLNILRHVQTDVSSSVDVLAEAVHLSRNACWRRLKRLEADGFIKNKVALIDPNTVDLGLMAIVMIKTHDHETGWLKKFKTTVASMPEIIGAHRMSGDLDYILRVRVRDVRAYDHFYQRLITKVSISEVSASFVMEDIKDTTALPI